MNSLFIALVILFVVALGFREIGKNVTRLDDTLNGNQGFNNNNDEQEI